MTRPVESLTAFVDLTWPYAKPSYHLIRKSAARMGELEEALFDIRNRILCPVGPTPTLDEIEEIACAALARPR